jgi:hypothetical protein
MASLLVEEYDSYSFRLRGNLRLVLAHPTGSPGSGGQKRQSSSVIAFVLEEANIWRTCKKGPLATAELLEDDSR